MSKNSIHTHDDGDEIKAVSGHIGFVFDETLLALPKGYVALGKVFFDSLVADDVKRRRYPAHEEWRALVALQRQLCDDALPVWLITDAVPSPTKIPCVCWGDDQLIAQALRSGWQDVGEGRRGIYVVKEDDLQGWLRVPAIRAELDDVTQPLSPFLQAMQLAASQLGISAINHGHKENEVVPAIQALWKKHFVPQYEELTYKQASWMATFVRWPEARGGKSNANNVARTKKSTGGGNIHKPSQSSEVKQKNQG